VEEMNKLVGGNLLLVYHKINVYGKVRGVERDLIQVSNYQSVAFGRRCGTIDHVYSDDLREALPE
jgi:hypothetical protein